jgi:hypothetical protein
MFGLFAPETVTFLELSSGLLAFVSSKKRSVGHCKVRLSIPDSPKPTHLDVPLYVIHLRRNTRGSGYVCVGRVELDEAQTKALTVQVKSIPVQPGYEMLARRSLRYPAHLKVICRDLPGFMAVTVDISRGGVRLMTQGPVALAAQATMNIELDAGSVGPSLPITGNALWCVADPQRKGGKSCLTGFEFQDIDAASEAILSNYLKSLAYRLEGDLQHRSISDGEVFIRPEYNVSKRPNG